MPILLVFTMQVPQHGYYIAWLFKINKINGLYGTLLLVELSRLVLTIWHSNCNQAFLSVAFFVEKLMAAFNNKQANSYWLIGSTIMWLAIYRYIYIYIGLFLLNETIIYFLKGQRQSTDLHTYMQMCFCEYLLSRG